MNIKYIIISLWLISSFVQAAELVFTPATPIVETGQQITLSVSGTSGKITWTASKGQIRGESNQVSYIAPTQSSIDAVVAIDDDGNVGIVKITVISKQILSMENANLEVFSNRSRINSLLLSEDERILWVATNGGLEQRDANTGELKRVFTVSDGLPYNGVDHIVNDSEGYIWISGKYYVVRSRDNETWESFDSTGFTTSLVADNRGGIWVGSSEHSLVHHSSDGTQKDITDRRTIIETDGNGGIWMGDMSSTNLSLTHRHADGTTEIFTPDNFDFPITYLMSLLNDNDGGIWIGNGEDGLAYFNIYDNKWKIFNTENSALPNNEFITLFHDNHGGLWISTRNRLVHYNTNNDVWKNFNVPEQLGKIITSIHTDGRNGLWVGTNYGLARFHYDNRWELVNTNLELPYNDITSLAKDGNNGFWIGLSGFGLVHKHANGNWETLNTNNSKLPDNNIQSIITDGNGGIWIGGRGGLTHFHADDGK